MIYTVFGNALQDAKVLGNGRTLVKVRENRRFTKADGSIGETHTDFNLWVSGREAYAAGVKRGAYVFATGEGDQTVDLYNGSVRVQNNVNFIHRFQYVQHTTAVRAEEAVEQQEVQSDCPF